MKVRNIKVGSAVEEDTDTTLHQTSKMSASSRAEERNSSRDSRGHTVTDSKNSRATDTHSHTGSHVTSNKKPRQESLEELIEDKIEEHLHFRMQGWKKCLHVVLFLFMFGNDLADFVSDWLFFVDVKVAQKGLVYGEPDPAAVWCLLFFSIVGTCTFCFECANLWWEFFRNNPWLDSDWLSAIVIWIEDVPQILISLYLSLCREDPISVFQLAKAAVILIGVVIRIVVTSVKYCNKDAVRSHHHVKIKAAIMMGIIVEALAAGAIFFLTQTERTHDGDVAFRIPNSLLEDTYNDQRYFTNVSVFFHSADLFDAGNLDTNKNDNVVNWLKLASIYSIKLGLVDTASFRIDYEQGSAGTNMAVSKKVLDSDNWTMVECYTLDPSTGTVSPIPNTTCSQAGFISNLSSIFIKLKYENSGALFRSRVFGDIVMNIKHLRNGSCVTVDSYADSVESNLFGGKRFTFHYYRTNETLNENDVKHLLTRGGVAQFYKNTDSELIDTSAVWKTGWRECDSNGNMAPVLDTSLSLACP